jgi:hypothetical protein
MRCPRFCARLRPSAVRVRIRWELFNEPFDIRPDGMVHAPDRPGLGFTLRADALERFRYQIADDPRRLVPAENRHVRADH